MKRNFLRIIPFVFLFALCINFSLEAFGFSNHFSHSSFNYLSNFSFSAPNHVELDWKGWFTVALLCIAFYSLVKEVLPPDMTMFLSAGVLVVSGIITPQQLLQGFAKDVLFTIAMLFIIVRTLELNGILTLISTKPPKAIQKSRFRRILEMMIILVPVGFLSAFLNNTPIVLMMAPLVRRWAIDNDYFPSKYLIPLSYAAILGGVCTLIGTSTNLVVDGLLRQSNPMAGLSFFELSYIGIPCVIVGYLYILTVGYYLLPNRQDPSTALSERSREFTGEFLVEEDSPLCNLKISEAGSFFRGEQLIGIERKNSYIDAPGPNDKILAGDRLIFAGDLPQIAKLHNIKGLTSLADPHFKLDLSSPHFSEVVISTTSNLIGKTLRRVNFRVNYGASVLAIYRQGKRVSGPIGDVVLQPGDVLMLLSNEPWRGKLYYSNDFYYIRHNEKIPSYTGWRLTLVLGILIFMIVLAFIGVPMMIASLTAAIAYIMTRSISIKEAQKSIGWNLLLLIGSSFAFGTALYHTGVAQYLAEFLLPVMGKNEYFLICGIFIITNVFTELVTNTAAALILYPIAISTANLAGFDSVTAIKAVGVTVAVAASCAFSTPIGYQTNTIVYGPGGYRFADYFKCGAPLSILLMIIVTLLVPYLWPLS